MTETPGISRGALLALLAGLIVVGLALFGAALLFVDVPLPGDPVEMVDNRDIRGEWRPDTAADCSKKQRLIITDHAVLAIRPDGVATPMLPDVQIVKFSETASPSLIVHVPGESPAVSWILTTDLKAEELRFVAMEWSEWATAMFGEQLEKMPSSAEFLQTLQRGEPYHRCSQGR